MNDWMETIRQIRERGYANIVPRPYSPSREFVDTSPPPHYQARSMCLFYGNSRMPIHFIAFGGVKGANAVAEVEFGALIKRY